MMHVRGFVQDYWKVGAGAAGWFLLLVTCCLVPAGFTYLYVLLWAGGATVAAGLFVLGYLRYSKPSRDPVTHKRAWQSEWVWLLAQAAVVFLVVGLSFTLRFINRGAATFDVDHVQQYRFTAGVFVTVFLEQAWLAWMWARQQVLSRRRFRETAAG